MTDNLTRNDSQADTLNHSAKKPKRESLLLNLAMNILLPTLILTKLSTDDRLKFTYALILALSFPLIYGLRDFALNKRFNVFSIIGFISVLLTGGISLLKLDTQYLIIKEADVPGLIGLICFASALTQKPLVRFFIYNDDIFNVEKMLAAVKESKKEIEFDKALRNGTFMIAGSFFLSSLLNYVLAKKILISPMGTAAANAEIGQMNALSIPVIAIPSTIVMIIAIFYIFHQIKKLTQLNLEDLMHLHDKN
ncbi:MAG: MFS transporter [Cellvibrio sp.]|nr:MFS transporter [Cellvibrio sp.]